MQSVVSFFCVTTNFGSRFLQNFDMHSYFTRSKVMSRPHSLHKNPSQEAVSTGLNKFNLPSTLTPGKQPNLAPNFDSSIGRSVSILRPG